jgi:CRP/FNR family transcriptional regulator, cyclic AMP receptor protein
MAVAEKHKEAVLASHFLLRHLPPEELRRLAAAASVARYPRHATIFKKGDDGASMMAVVRGKVKISTYSDDGKELLLNIIDQGGVFGEIALLDGRPRSADAAALEETDLLVLGRAQLMPVLTGNPEALARLLAVLCQRVRRTSEHLEDAMLRDAPARLARGLLRLAETFGQPGPGGGVRLGVKLSQQQIGSLVGTTRESVSRQLAEWQRAGHVAVEAGSIVLRDPKLLERIAEAEA